MPKTYIQLQSELEARIARLQKRQDALREKERARAVPEIVQKMRALGITLEDLSNALARGKRRTKRRDGAAAAAAASGSPSARPARLGYRDPQSGRTWSGYGPRPAWLRELEARGATVERMRAG